MAKRIKKVVVSTLIIVGEGACEKAFLSHLKQLFSNNTNQKVKVDSADGGSPYDIVNTTVKKTKHIAYDKKYILMDSDIVIDEKTKKLAKENNIHIIESIPLCLEGMLLDVLGQKIPSTSIQCKNILHPQLSGSPTDKDSYSSLFMKSLLENSNVASMKELVAVMKNQ